MFVHVPKLRDRFWTTKIITWQLILICIDGSCYEVVRSGRLNSERSLNIIFQFLLDSDICQHIKDKALKVVKWNCVPVLCWQLRLADVRSRMVGGSAVSTS
jgi:hypothetical protein